MLKTISSITNALGALNYKGTWNASTNTPTLTSSVGAKGDYYVVSVAGSTNLNGETLWGVGDWAVFNGSVWQRVEGGDTINATTVTASTSVSTPVIQALSSAGGTIKNNGGTNQMQWGSGGGNNLSLEVATNINPANAAVNISPTGTGTVTINPATASTMNNVAIGGTTALAGSFTTVTATTGNVVIATSGQGIDFSATPGTGTSELLADYEEGTFTPVIAGQLTAGTGTYTTQVGTYTKIGRVVYVSVNLAWSAHTGTGDMQVNGLPFTVNSTTQSQMSNGTYDLALTALNMLLARAQTSGTFIKLLQSPVGGGAWNGVPMDTSVTVLEITGFYTV
jgi:hypothetical protein